MTARCFAVNSNNDVFIGNDGNLAIVTDLDGTLQSCEHAVKTILGEMILAVDEGIPDFETVWNGVPNLQQYEAAIRSAILNIDGVVEITSFFTERDKGTLKYTAVIKTIYGVGSITNG